MEVQLSLAHHIQAMVKSERNRQIMCEGGLVSILLAHCQSMLLTPNHPLHLPVTRILEKLSSQCITPSDFRSVMHINWSLYSKYFFFVLNPQYCLYNLSLLRKFLCLGDPLMCLGDKTAKQIQSECNPETNGPVSNGTHVSGFVFFFKKSINISFHPLEI